MNSNSYIPSPDYRGVTLAVTLLIKQRATPWRRIILKIPMITQVAKKPHLCVRTRKVQLLCSQTLPLLSYTNLVLVLKSCFLEIYFNSIISPTSLLSSVSPPFSFLHYTFYAISYFPCTLHSPFI